MLDSIITPAQLATCVPHKLPRKIDASTFVPAFTLTHQKSQSIFVYNQNRSGPYLSWAASLAHLEASKLPLHFTLCSPRTKTLSYPRPGRGSGVYLITKQPIVVPKAHVLLEAFLRICARDSGKRVGSFGMAMIGYVEQYVDDDGLLDVDRLPEPLRTLYKCCTRGENR